MSSGPDPRFWTAERTDGGAEQLPGRRLLNHYFLVAEAPGRRREAGAEGSADRLVRSAHCHTTLEIRGLNTTTPARLRRIRKWILCNAPYSRYSLRSRMPH